jgi:3-deoxy-D-manno-octulosonic acid kinase
MLADWGLLGNSRIEANESIFDPKFWAPRNELQPAPGGRGSAWFVGNDGQWVLRHYRRGGFAARLSEDRYWWLSEVKVRAFAEWYLHQAMRERGLPVPKPVAAAYRRSGFTYRCDLITERIWHVRSLSAVLAEASLAEAAWRALGGVIAQFHRAGVDHADLNAHNILYAEKAATFSVIDFDRGRLRGAGELAYLWQLRNLRRLHRSLAKVAPPARFTPREWDWLRAGYR